MEKFAFLFPGQASQYVGMGRDLCAEFAAAQATFDEADELLGFALSKLCFDGPEEELRQTAVTQPAVFVHSMAAWRLLEAEGLKPACTAGHSLGEYSALVAAGALEFAAGLALVRKRGELMQQAGAERPGSMAAIIGLEDELVVDLCRQASSVGIVVAANFNAPGQLVVSGEQAGVARLGELAGEAGAKKVIELAVSGAFHSPLMAPAAEQMEGLLREAPIGNSERPVITNVSARPVEDPDELRQHLIDQITQPVRWTESIQCLSGLGVGPALEVGPGAVLKGMVRRIERGLGVHCVGKAEEVEAGIAAVSQ
jgi:[acyl-carrier-protein] S-malonyltransferase